MNQLKTEDHKLKNFSALLLLLPVLVFAGYWHLYAVDVPWFDDFEALPGFLLQYLDAPTAGEKLHWLFWPNNEHRMAYGRAVVLFLHALTGEINFRGLEAVANASTLGLLALFFGAFRRLNLPWLLFLPVPLILFQPQYHLLSFWSITGLQHQPVLLFVFLAMYLLALGKPGALAGALVAALLATFTMSNGMLAWAAGAGVLVLQARWRGLALWLLVAGMGVGAYFYGFPSRANANSFAQFLKTPELSLAGFFTFWGGAFDFLPNASSIVLRAALPTAAGLGLAGFMGFWVWRRGVGLSELAKKGGSDRRLAVLRSAQGTVRYFLLGCLLFLLANALIVAVLRPHFGYHVLLVSNYKLYPTLVLVLAYLMFLENATRTGAATRTAANGPVSGCGLAEDQARLPGEAQPLTGPLAAVRVALTASVLFWLLSYLVYTPDVSLRRRTLLANTYNQLHGGIGLGATRGDVGETYIQRVFNETIRRGLYYPPDPFSAALASPDATPAALNVTIGQDDAFFSVKNDTLSPPNGRENAAYLWVRGKTDQFLYPAIPPPNPGRNPFARGSGFVANIHRHNLRPGLYNLSLCIFKNGTLTAYPIHQTLTP